MNGNAAPPVPPRKKRGKGTLRSDIISQSIVSNTANSTDYKVGLVIGANDFRNGHPNTLIGEGVDIRGELQFEKLLRIDGIFEGVLISDGDLIIGPKGTLLGDASNLKNVFIDGGYMKGNIFADTVILQENATVHGDITCKTLQCDKDVIIVGFVNVHFLAPEFIDHDGDILSSRPKYIDEENTKLEMVRCSKDRGLCEDISMSPRNQDAGLVAHLRDEVFAAAASIAEDAANIAAEDIGIHDTMILGGAIITAEGRGSNNIVDQDRGMNDTKYEVVLASKNSKADTESQSPASIGTNIEPLLATVSIKAKDEQVLNRLTTVTLEEPPVLAPEPTPASAVELQAVVPIDSEEAASIESLTQATAPIESLTQAPAPIESLTQAPAPIESLTQAPAPIESLTQAPAPIEPTSIASLEQPAHIPAESPSPAVPVAVIAPNDETPDPMAVSAPEDATCAYDDGSDEFMSTLPVDILGQVPLVENSESGLEIGLYVKDATPTSNINMADITDMADAAATILDDASTTFADTADTGITPSASDVASASDSDIAGAQAAQGIENTGGSSVPARTTDATDATDEIALTESSRKSAKDDELALTESSRKSAKDDEIALTESSRKSAKDDEIALTESSRKSAKDDELADERGEGGVKTVRIGEIDIEARAHTHKPDKGIGIARAGFIDPPRQLPTPRATNEPLTPTVAATNSTDGTATAASAAAANNNT